MNFAEHMGDLPIENGSQLLLDAVEEGMSPFRVRSGDVYIEYDIDTHVRWIIAEILLASGAHISHKEPINDWDLQKDPSKEVLRIAGLMLTAFRQRKGELVNERIVLGEN